MTWKITDAEFLRAIVHLKDAPGDKPAVAFVGRSNVGKSSLINKLLNKHRLARTSSTPGCTQQLVYFEINKDYYFIDLPGYGYANVPRREHAKWDAMMERFFQMVQNLRLVIILIDVRRMPTPEDQQMIAWLGAAGHPYIFAVTKCDKITRGERNRALKELEKTLGLPDPTALVPVSSRTGDGMDDLLDVIREALEAPASNRAGHPIE